MFEAFPDRDRLGGWSSWDAVLETHARTAISDAAQKKEKAQAEYDRAFAEADDPKLAHSYADHLTFATRQAAAVARIQAILLTAIHIEGVVNAWGVFSLGQSYFQQHLERTSIESKVALLLAIGGWGRIPLDHDALVHMRRLFNRRNQLVHRKTREMRMPLKELARDAPRMEEDLNVCKAALDAFHALLVSTAPRTVLVAGGIEGPWAP